MATMKRFSFLYGTSGLTVYAVILQVNSGHYLDDADGAFAVDPADKYQEMTEDLALAGRYTYEEDRTAWADGPYEILCYSQLGAAPDPTTDTPIAAGSFTISGDETGEVLVAALVEYALCTLPQVKAELGISESNTSENYKLCRAINAATDMIETLTNRKLMKRSVDLEEYHDNADEDDHDSSLLWPREYPIESVSDVTSLEHGTHASRTAIDLADIAIDRQRVIVTPGMELEEGTRAIRLVYSPGYTNAPHDIQGVAINLAQRLYWVSKRIQAGDSDETAGGVSRRAKAEAFSAEDQLVIDEYRRVQSGDWKVGQAKRYREWTR